MRAHQPKLAHLRSFLHVAREHSISKAAAALDVSQPTITDHVQKLEDGYGRRLFERGPNGVTLTAAGEALRRMVEPHLDQLESLTFADRPIEAHIGLGGPPDLLSLRVLPSLKQLYADGISVRVRPGRPPELLEHLENGTLDMFIATAHRESTRVEVRYQRLFDEEYVLVGSKEWNDRVQSNQEPGLSVEEIELRVATVLAEAPFLAFDQDLPLIRDHPLVLRHSARIFGPDPLKRVPLIMPDLRALREVALTGAGVAVIPRYIVQDALRDGSLFELYAPPNRKLNTLYIAHRSEPLTAVQERLVTWLRKDAAAWEDDRGRAVGSRGRTRRSRVG